MNKLKISKKVLYIIVLALAVLFGSVATVCAERIIASSIVSYSNATSGLKSTDVQGALDELYAKCIEAPTFANYLQTLDNSETIMKSDGTADNNMRYIGSSPNNYVTFSGEEWRVIGVFNNVGNGAGKTETRVKIIRSESLGFFKWHGNEVNTWASADLNIEFQKLAYVSSNLIEPAEWYLGDYGGSLRVVSSIQYESERKGPVASGNNLKWTGKIGLMYSSDFGFASSACKDGNLYDYFAEHSECVETDWLFTRNSEWLLSPVSNKTNNSRYVSSGGFVDGGNNGGIVTSSAVARPVVYLKSDIVCMNCSDSTAGTKNNPFKIWYK